MEKFVHRDKFHFMKKNEKKLVFKSFDQISGFVLGEEGERIRMNWSKERK